MYIYFNDNVSFSSILPVFKASRLINDRSTGGRGVLWIIHPSPGDIISWPWIFLFEERWNEKQSAHRDT